MADKCPFTMNDVKKVQPRRKPRLDFVVVGLCCSSVNGIGDYDCQSTITVPTPLAGAI